MTFPDGNGIISPMNREQAYILILQGFRCHFPYAEYYKENRYLKLGNFEYQYPLYPMDALNGEWIEVAVLDENGGVSVEFRYGNTFLGKSLPSTTPQGLFALAKSISMVVYENISHKDGIILPEAEDAESGRTNMVYRFKWGMVHGGMPK